VTVMGIIEGLRKIDDASDLADELVGWQGR
jgi:hypothetical protein